MEFIEEIEKIIDNLANNEYGIKIKKTTLRGIISADITIPKKTFTEELTDTDILFRLIIDTFCLKIIPRLYCLTPYCFPHLADGRDLFKELRNSSQGLVFEHLLSDLLEFVKINFERGGLIFCGNYYLGSKYDLRILQQGCKNIINVKENLLVNGKNVKYNRVLVLSDVYFLLFEQEKWSKNNLTLEFWSSLNNIEKIQKVKDNKTVILHWTQKNKDNPYLMNLSINDRESFIRDLLEKMKTFGMNFDIMKINKDNKVEHDTYSSASKLQNKKVVLKNKTNIIKKEDEEKEKEEEEEEEEEEDEKEVHEKDDKKKGKKEDKNNEKNDDEKEEKKEMDVQENKEDIKKEDNQNKEEKKNDNDEEKIDD